MIRAWERGRADSAGTSLVEFALLAPVLIFLLVGLIEITRYAYFGIVTEHAARAGVQYAAQNTTTAADASVNGPSTKNAALQDAPSLSNLKVQATIMCTINGQVSTCPSNTANSVPENLVYYVEVQVSGTFSSLMKYPGIPQQLPIGATAIMPVGNQ